MFNNSKKTSSMLLFDRCANISQNIRALFIFSLLFLVILLAQAQGLDNPPPPASFIPQNPNTTFFLKKSCNTFNKPELRPSSILSFGPGKEPIMRAWTCHGRNQRDMVEKLTQAKIVHSETVKEALLRVDRANYANDVSGAYTDAPQPIGFRQTISAPHMHAHALEELLPVLKKMSKNEQLKIVKNGKDKNTEPGELKILDVGCGSGYLSVAFGRMVDRGSKGPIPPLQKGRVFGIDVVPELVDISVKNTKKADQDLMDSGTVSFSVGDGWQGLPSEAPFHAIHVGAAADKFPQNLMMQLYPYGGTMVIPVGPEGGFQNLFKVERLRENNIFNKEDFKIDTLLGVRYVPLVGPMHP